MKKIIMMMAALLTISQSACSQANKTKENKDMKVLVAYFSASGMTKGVAQIPFATSGGSSIKKACEDLKATYPNINWKEGKLLNRASKDDLKKWVESNL